MARARARAPAEFDDVPALQRRRDFDAGAHVTRVAVCVKPWPGRIVVAHMKDGKTRPAIVTEVRRGASVDLFVFVAKPGLEFSTYVNVPHVSVSDVGWPCWSWPVRA